MPLDPARVAESRAWLTRAALDLRAAEFGRTGDPLLASDVVFHCQQMVEKAMKAFLTWHDRPFGKTHNLVELGQQCAAIVPELEPVLRRTAWLTEYAWKYRYPGEPDLPSREETEEALGTAKEAYEALISRLPSEVRP
ncbi:MAG: HEPN domain-containing protein [Armatimonadetes bacterium]|nr:HEPN domain-containing protein [Armatimonadota bacterium]